MKQMNLNFNEEAKTLSSPLGECSPSVLDSKDLFESRRRKVKHARNSHIANLSRHLRAHSFLLLVAGAAFPIL